MPIQAPALPIDCANGRAREMADLRGSVVRVVAATDHAEGHRAAIPPQNGVPVVTLTLARDSGGQPVADGCLATGAAGWMSYATLSGVPPDALAGLQFLVDPDGWLRTRDGPAGTTAGLTRSGWPAKSDRFAPTQSHSPQEADISTHTKRDPGARRTRVMISLAGLMLALLLLGAGGFLWLNGSQLAPVIGGPFTLQDGDGHTVTDRDLHGKYLLVYFGYTFCPDVCPTTLTAVADAVDKLGAKADQLQPLFITVDPKRDNAATVKQYAASFTPRLIGLTGTPDQIATVAREYRVYHVEHRTGPGPNDYSIDHSSILYLMAPDGRFIAPIDADQSGDQIAAAIRKLTS